MALVENYRPQDWTDFIGNKDIVLKVKNMVDTDKLSHMLFIGPAGTGKTSLAYVYAKQVLKGNFEFNFKEVNASNQRGVDKLRQEILPFIKAMPIMSKYKVLFLDEVDGITQEGQQMLRRVMEEYQTVIFVLAANEGNTVIKPIQSRCVPFFFKKLETNEIKELIIKVSGKENIKLTEDEVNTITTKANGDGRIAINLLFSNIETLSKWDFTKIPKDFVELTKYVRMVVRRGDSELFLISLFDWIEERKKLNEEIIKLFSDIDFRIQNSRFQDPHLMYLLFILNSKGVM